MLSSSTSSSATTSTTISSRKPTSLCRRRASPNLQPTHNWLATTSTSVITPLLLIKPLGVSANFRSIGRIRAVQLSYTEAHDQLQQAIRRAAPPITAPGFYQTAHKFFVVVELLMGEIPDRRTFRHPVLEKALQPYSEIVQGTLLFSSFVSASVVVTSSFARSSCARRLPCPIPDDPRLALRAIRL
jgi:hypothetical protein